MRFVLLWCRLLYLPVRILMWLRVRYCTEWNMTVYFLWTFQTPSTFCRAVDTRPISHFTNTFLLVIFSFFEVETTLISRYIPKLSRILALPVLMSGHRHLVVPTFSIIYSDVSCDGSPSNVLLCALYFLVCSISFTCNDCCLLSFFKILIMR